MERQQWIESYGGPLICMEAGLKNLWGGVDRLTSDLASGARNDYERACECRLLLNQVSLSRGQALVLGDHPFKTTFWQFESNCLYILRVRWVENFRDINVSLSAAEISALQPIEDEMHFIIKTSDLVVFDSVEDGASDIPLLKHLVRPGQYTILTKAYEPDNLTAFYVHEFRLASY